MISKEYLKKNFNITKELTRKKVKSQYRNSFLGMIWSILHPLLNMLIMWLVFGYFFGRNDFLYPVYLLTGNILFGTLRQTTSSALSSITENRGLLLKLKINNYVFPLSSVFHGFVNTFFSFLSLIFIMLILQIFTASNLFGYQILFIILEIPAFFLFVFGIGLFLSALFVFFRDIRHLYEVFLTLWTYLTPIFYKVDVLPKSSAISIILKLNPMYHFLTYFRESMYMLASTGSTMPPSWKTLGLLFALGIASFTIGFLVFKKLKKHFVMYV